MRRTIRALGAATALCAAAVPGTAAPVPSTQLEPITVWRLDYGVERCTLVRDFGNGTSRAHLQIESFGRSDEFEVLVSGNVIPEESGAAGKVGVRLTGDPEDIEIDDLQGKAAGSPSVYFSLSFISFAERNSWEKLNSEERRKLASTRIIHPEAKFEDSLDSLSLRFRHLPPLQLNLGNMAKPLAAMRTCVDALVKSWGGDPDVQNSLSREAAPAKQTVRKVQADYPSDLLMRGVSAFVPVRLSIDAMGHPSNCVVQIENVDAAFRQAVCQNLAGAFEPALDKDGKPVPFILSTGVIYKIAQ